MAFRVAEYLPGVYHIEDALGVCMTLLTGSKQALLVDTGYGFENVRALVRDLTDRPLTVLLTHGHHDHALGARWFDDVYLHPLDLPVYEQYTGEEQRRKVIENAHGKGIGIQEDEYMRAKVPKPRDLIPGDVDLGDMKARVLHLPGHTPGSCTVFVPERSLMLTGDNWNPCTWLFFKEALPVGKYRRSLHAMLEYPFRHVLCPHSFRLMEQDMIRDFAEALTDEVLESAMPVDTGAAQGVRTAQVRLPHGQILVFDVDKYIREKEDGR
ncbi:MAG: MBL fold metallo-hydrolase [Clostridia bacterium]|nr:MBL fold metallo-hydrolase [Clostridia bacterium]